MARHFLIGQFLQSHASAYRYRATRLPEGASISPSVLRGRFSERARRFRAERGKYGVYVQGCFVLALLILVAAFNLNFQLGDGAPMAAPPQELLSIQDIIQTRQILKPPPPPRPPIPVEVPNDEILEDDPLLLDASLDIDLGVPSLPPPPAEVEPEDDSDEIFVVVEEMPTMVGGMPALVADLVYPKLAQRAGIEGTSVIRVIVDREGNPSQPTVIKSAHELLDQAAIDAVLEQRFTPGRQRGRPVLVQVAIPVRFVLRIL